MLYWLIICIAKFFGIRDGPMSVVKYSRQNNVNDIVNNYMAYLYIGTLF